MIGTDGEVQVTKIALLPTVNKSDIKRWNTLGCIDQYMAPVVNTLEVNAPPPQMQTSALKNVLSTFDEQDKLSSERIHVSSHSPSSGWKYREHKLKMG